MSVLVLIERNMKNVAFINASLLLYPFSKCFTQLSHHIMRYRFAGLQKKGETGEPNHLSEKFGAEIYHFKGTQTNKLAVKL